MATWYAAGTATFTNGSATVTGIGSAWIANVAVGEEIRAPDGKGYEIIAITSDTALTIDPAYLGATSAGAAYKIVPVRGADRQVQTRVGELLAETAAVMDGIGQGKMDDGDVLSLGLKFQADQDSGLFRDGGNNWCLVSGGNIVARLESDGATFDLKSVSGAGVQSSVTDSGAGKLLKTGAFGLGDAIALTATDNLNTLTETGFYYNATGNNTLGNNYPISSAGSLVNIYKSSSHWTQEFTAYGNTDVRKYIRSISSAGWSPWVEVMTSDNLQTSFSDSTADRLLKTGAFGLGNAHNCPNNNIDEAFKTGFYTGYSGLNAGVTLGDNPFPNLGGAFTLIVTNPDWSPDVDYTSQIAMSLSGTVPEMKIRSNYNVSGAGWSPWRLMMTVDDAGSYSVNGNQLGASQMFIADDAVATITPPRNGGFMTVTVGGSSAYPNKSASAQVYFDVGSSLYIEDVWTSSNGSLVDISTSDVTGITGIDTHITIAVQPGAIKIENRLGGGAAVQITFS